MPPTPSPLRVLFIVTAYPRHAGDIITPWLGEAIRQLARRGIHVEVLAPAYRGLGDHAIDGVPVHRFRYAPRRVETLTHDRTTPDLLRARPWYAALLPGYVAAGMLAAARLARTGRFDVVHAFWPLPHALLGLAARRAGGIPLVSTFFGVELTWLTGARSRGRALFGAVVRRLAAGSDAVTAISRHTAGHLERVAPGTAVDVVPFGAAVDVDAVADLARDDVAPPAGRPLALLFVGRLVERKGVDVLLDALARARCDATLDVVGDGPERPPLERRASSLGLTARVRFHGACSADALARRYAGSDALVLPARPDAKGDVEGLGVVLLEALAHGLPVIASAVGGIPDIVRDGETGLLVPPADPDALADAIAGLAARPDRGRLLGAAGRAFARRHFGWPGITARLEAIYRRVIAERARAS